MAYLIAFSSGWKMTLVVTASIPLMVIAGGIQASVMTGFSSQVLLCSPDINKITPVYAKTSISGKACHRKTHRDSNPQMDCVRFSHIW